MILADCFRGSVESAAHGVTTSEIELQDDSDIWKSTIRLPLFIRNAVLS